MPIDIKTYLLDKNIKSAREAARISDKYYVIHEIKSQSFIKTNNNLTVFTHKIVHQFKILKIKSLISLDL